MVMFLRTSEEIVAKYYNKHCEYEEKRLFQDHYHMLEFIITFHYLKKYIPKEPSYILDCGCGSGTYAIVLAGMGHYVALVDISEKLLELAKKKFQRTGRMNRVLAIVKTSCRDLSILMMNSLMLCYVLDLYIIFRTQRIG